MADQFAVKLDAPWDEPSGLAAPTAEQITGGVVIRMTACLSGIPESYQADDFLLMDPGQAAGLVAADFARYPTDRERKCAAAVGAKWPKGGVKESAPAKAKAKGKAKAKAAEAPAESEPWEG